MSKRSRPRDHPRVCGEHIDPNNTEADPVGSSPRVRGTRRLLLQHVDELGIIPARAGNTFEGVDGDIMVEDHPRVCGEHLPFRKRCSIPPGSSPRVRGTQSHQKLRGWQDGIIPACAGNTQSLLLFGCRIVDAEVVDEFGIIPACAGNTSYRAAIFHLPRDHPRVCGEHRSKLMRCAGFGGSSPRVRGTQTMPNAL